MSEELEYRYTRQLHYCADGWNQDVYVQRPGDDAEYLICEDCDTYPSWWDRG